MQRDYIHTDKNNYKLHIVALAPDLPKRIILIPPLVGARGVLEIRTFRYLLREGCNLMSFDYAGHYSGLNKKFTLESTFKDTEVALTHALEYAHETNLPLHVIGACFGLIPLLFSLNKLGWPRQVRSMFSVNGLLGINDLLNFDGYKLYLAKKGLIFDTKLEFINYMVSNKETFFRDKEKIIDAMTEYLLELFPELKNIISSDRFGALEYSRAEFHKTFYEFMITELPRIIIPEDFPCLFFLGTDDTTFNFQTSNKKVSYLKKIKEMASHAKILNIRIDHFGRGKDHYVIGKEGIKFIIKNDFKKNTIGFDNDRYVNLRKSELHEH